MIQKITLDDVVREYGEDEIIQIGSISGYFFIGTPKEYEEMIDGISKQYEEYFKRRAEETQAELESLCGAVEKEKDEKTYHYVDRLLKRAMNIVKAHDAAARARQKRRDFTDLRTREIKNRYRLPVGGFKAIIVEGCEIGEYWDKEEWDKAHSEKG